MEIAFVDWFTKLLLINISIYMNHKYVYENMGMETFTINVAQSVINEILNIVKVAFSLPR